MFMKTGFLETWPRSERCPEASYRHPDFSGTSLLDECISDDVLTEILLNRDAPTVISKGKRHLSRCTRLRCYHVAH